MTTSPGNDPFTDHGFWTPQTFMLRSIRDWVLQVQGGAPASALSIDDNPTLDRILLERWPALTITRAVYPAMDCQRLGHIGDDMFDIVYSHQVIEHVPKPWLAGRELVRVLKRGGLGIHTTCAFNPRHGPPAFNDYYRFLPDGLGELFDGVEVLVKAGWGNREALIYNLAIDDGHGDLGGRRFHPDVGRRNDELYPWVKWIVFRKK
jgi:SAM-dependent methyltransferase